MTLVRLAVLALAAAVQMSCIATFGGTDRAVLISPNSIAIEFGDSVSFTASVKGLSNTGITWSLQEENAGSIDGKGLYTAPARSGTFHVVAESSADTNFKAVAVVNVVSPSARIGMGPHVAFIAPSQQVKFTAGVSGLLPGDPTGVDFSVEESGGGTIEADGLYTAPATPGVYHVLAAARADVTRVDRATVTVANPGGAVPVDRLTIFNPGLTALGGIPKRTRICSTLSPAGGDDTAAINAAIASCSPGQVVKLNAGVFNISGQGISIEKSNVTLRGAGPALTRLIRTDNASYSMIAIGRRYGNGKLILPVNLASDGAKGAYSITLASAPAPALTVGEIVFLDKLTDDTIVRWSDRSPLGHASRAWFSRMDRPITQILEVASINGTTVTFTTPLHTNFETAFTAQLVRHGEGTSNVRPTTKHVGVEDLYVEGGRGGDGGGNIHFFVAAYSWAKNVESKLSRGSSINLNSSFRCEVRDSIIHTAADPNPGGSGYLVSINYGASDNLVENNVIWSGNKVTVMRASGGGNVVAYNYAQDAFGAGYPTFIETGLNAAHMAAAHHELFEGNESFNFDADAVWGNAVFITVLRNNFTGLRTSKPPLVLNDVGNRRAIGLTKWSWYYSFFGNVLGYEGQQLIGSQRSFAYESLPGVGSPSGFSSSVFPMWQLGYNSGDFSELADPRVLSTVLRHGNYDYVTNRVVWEPSISEQTVPDSFYLSRKPAFFGDHPWPWVEAGASNTAERTRVLPAKLRFETMP